MNRVKYIILFLSLTVVACTTKNETKDAIPQINIELNDKNSTIHCSDILNLDRIVVLETSDKSIIGNIDDVIVNDSIIYVLDKRVTKSIFIFNYKGRFIKMINQLGKGPNEYISLNSITYDNFEGKLVVMDGVGRKVLVYNRLGDFEKIIKVDDYFDQVHVLDKDHYVFYSDFSSRKHKQISISNKDGKVVERFMDISGKHFDSGYGQNVFCLNNDLTLFALPYDNTIYSVSGNKLVPYCDLLFGDLFIDSNAKNMSSKEVDKLRKKHGDGKIISKFNRIARFENMLYCSFTYNFMTYSMFYDMNEHRIVHIGELTSDINNLFIGDKKPIGLYKDELIFKLEPNEELYRYNRIKTIPDYAQGTLKYKTLFESLDSSHYSNPALLFFKLKS
jgi:hypothetical protein